MLLAWRVGDARDKSESSLHVRVLLARFPTTVQWKLQAPWSALGRRPVRRRPCTSSSAQTPRVFLPTMLAGARVRTFVRE
jgi:hypothetical protein